MGRISNALYRAGILCIVIVGFQFASSAQRTPDGHLRSVTLWAREVNGRALYWVGQQPVGRHPLSGLEQSLGPNIDVRLSVILDSRVRISEIFEIDGVLDKIPIKHVRYYVFDADYPQEMREISWNPSTRPLPGPAPRL